MNTKNKIVAILMASMVAMAVAAPMAMGQTETAGTSVAVGTVAPNVVSVEVTPDPVTMDTYPNNTTITVNATVSDANGRDDIAYVNITGSDASGHLVESLPVTMNKIEDIDETSAKYQATLNLTCCTPADTYNVTVEAKDQDGQIDTGTGTFTVSSTVAITVTDVNFGNVAPGGTGTNSSTVTCIGNAEVNFTDASPTGYDNPDDNDGIAWSNMSCTTSATCGTEKILDDQITTTWSPATTITCGNSAEVPFTLDVPEGTLTGSYGGTITFTPTKA